MNRTVERQIKKIYEAVYKKVFSQYRIKELSHGNRIPALQYVTNFEQSAAYNKFAKKFAIELAKSGLLRERGVWREFYKAAKSTRNVAIPKTYKAFEIAQMQKAVQHNFKMIKSIPERTLEVMTHKYTETLINEVAKGKLSRGDFQKELASHGHKNAKLIARTETAKLQTAITESRASDLGSVVYRWISSRDSRTRESHAIMNNVYVFWRSDLEKPLLDGMYGNAGEFPNCRCAPLPVVNIISLRESRYKVYDYRKQNLPLKQRIITLTKAEFIQAIQDGGLQNIAA